MRILSREQALKVKPSLPDFLQRELEHALIIGQGLQTLSDGTKVYTPPAWQRLRGGAISRAEADKTFTALITQASNVDTSSQDALVAACTQMHGYVQTLVTFTKSASDQMQEQIVSGEKASANLIDKRRELHQTKKIFQIGVDQLQAQVTALNSNIEDTQKKLSQGEEEMKKAIIRLASTPIINPIKMVIEKLQTDLKSLQSTQEETCQRRDRQKTLILQLETEIGRLKKEEEAKDSELKKSGAILTALKNIQQSLHTLLAQYEFLTDDIERIKQFAHSDSLASRLQDDFLIDLKNVQRDFAAIEYKD